MGWIAGFALLKEQSSLRQGVSTEHNSTDEKTVQYLLLDLGYTN